MREEEQYRCVLRKRMNCKNCGTPLPDGAKFCGACGALQEVAAPVEAPAAVAPVEAPVEAPAVAPVEAPVEAAAEVAAPVEMPYAAPADFADPDFSADEPKKKKFKLKRIILPAVAVLSAAAVLLCVFNWGWIKLWFTDMFGKPEALRDKVVAEQTETLANNLSKQYGNSIRTMKDVMNGDKYVSASMELIVSDEAEDLLANVLGAAVGDADTVADVVSMLDGSYVTFGAGNTDDLFQLAYQVGIGGKELLSIGAIADLVNRELYVAVPTLSDYYLDLSTYFADAMAELEASIQQEDIEAMAAAAELLDALPSEEVVNKLLKKYIAVALAEFDDVSKDKETLSIGGIKEKVTVLETSVSEADALAAVKAVLKEVAKDSDIEKIIVDFVDTVNGIEDTGMSGDEVYEELMASIDLALESLDDVDADTEEILVVTQYLNSSYEVVGIALEAEDEDVLYYATATKGNDFACEMEVNGMTIMTGKGTNKKGIVNGTFKIKAEDQNIATIKVSNFDKNVLEEGGFKGSFEIVPDAELMDMALSSADLPSAITSVISLTDMGLKVDINKSANNSSVKLSITSDGEDMLGIKFTTSITDKPVTAPSADRTTDDVQEWVSTIDYDALLDALIDLGLPSDLLNEGLGSLLGT